MIKEKLLTLPKKPGCYLMKDKEGTIIYVGKAINLYNRVNSYFRGAHDYKTTKMVSSIVDFDYIVTKSEKEALILEYNLIKQYDPYFNIVFKDDKSYPYILLSDSPEPYVSIIRLKKNQKVKGRLFGPFPDVGAARHTLDILNKLYPFRKCKNMPNKTCLYYHIKQCLGPCEYSVDPKIYENMANNVISFLNGDNEKLIRELNEKMIIAADELNFEQAKEYNELIKAIEHISDKQDIQNENNANLDAFNYYHDKGYISIQGLFVRHGIILEKEFKLIPLYGDEVEEFVSFVIQYYEHHPFSSQLVLPNQLDISLLDEVLDVKIFQPQKGYRQKILDMAYKNAKEQLELKFENQNKQNSLLEASVNEFSALLNKEIHKVELYDNSHIQGTFNVSAMVVYEDGLPVKKDYRLYKLQQYQGDTNSMKEVIYRRYYRLLMEDKALCDCIIVDGGIMQIKAVKEVLDSLNIDMLVVGLVKDDKHNTANLVNDENKIIPIDKDSNLFFLLTRMQDEVHRFAISYHRKLRTKAQKASILDEIEGIGPVRKKKLLNHFKSFKKLKEASEEEIAKVVGKDVAINVFKTLHNEL